VKFTPPGTLPPSKSSIMDEFDLHLTGGKSSRDTDPVYMDVPEVEKDGDGRKDPDVVVDQSGDAGGFSMSSPGKLPGRFSVFRASEENEFGASYSPCWFEAETLTMFNLVDPLNDAMEVDPATAEDIFVPD